MDISIEVQTKTVPTTMKCVCYCGEHSQTMQVHRQHPKYEGYAGSQIKWICLETMHSTWRSTTGTNAFKQPSELYRCPYHQLNRRGVPRSNKVWDRWAIWIWRQGGKHESHGMMTGMMMGGAMGQQMAGIMNNMGQNMQNGMNQPPQMPRTGPTWGGGGGGEWNWNGIMNGMDKEWNRQMEGMEWNGMNGIMELINQMDE